MIPKIIHYCWFGKGKKPEETVRYINGWKKQHPDYEIAEWNEENFDIQCNAYVQEAYGAGKWAFVSDYVRLYALYHTGGIYLDTDVEVLRSFESLRNDTGFLGFECNDCIMTGVMAVQKHSRVIHHLMDDYENRHFVGKDGKMNMTTNVFTTTRYLRECGLMADGKMQRVAGFTVYPQRFFAPNTPGMVFGKKPKDAYAIHHYFASWIGSGGMRMAKDRLFHCMGGKLRNMLGTPVYGKIRKKEWL